MIIKVSDVHELMDREACWGSTNLFPQYYTVLAIMQFRRRKQYLIDFDGRLFWWNANLFKIVDESFPENWIIVQYKKCHKYKNKKYDFDIPISFYQGPNVFLDNQDFFFDIIENPREAYEFYYDCIKSSLTIE